MYVLGVVYLSKIKDWNLIITESKRSQAVFVNSEYHTKLSHFGFAFITKNISDLFNFTITLIGGNGNKLFPQTKQNYLQLVLKFKL